MKQVVMTSSEYQSFVSNNKEYYIGGDCSDNWYVNAGGEVICVICGCDEDYYYINYEITLKELRGNGTFLYECLTNGDVNHSLGIMKEYQIFKNDIDEVMDFFSENTNVPPVSSCGMQNYVVDILHQECVELTKIDRTSVVERIEEKFTPLIEPVCLGSVASHLLTDNVIKRIQKKYGDYVCQEWIDTAIAEEAVKLLGFDTTIE